MRGILGVLGFGCFGVSDSIKNHGVFDTHNFSWKFYRFGGLF